MTDLELDLDAIKAQYVHTEYTINAPGSSHIKVIAELTTLALYVPALVAEVERLTAFREEVKAWHRSWTDHDSRLLLLPEASTQLWEIIYDRESSGTPTPDLECIQPDATERDKWGFGEVPAELTHETALLGWHQCAAGKVRVNGAKCLVCNWVVPASTTGSHQ